MAPLYILNGVSAKRGCRKPNCGSLRTYRHHRGDEHRFVRYLRAGRRSAWFKAFVKRYNTFQPEDVVEICGDHHEEIHAVIYKERIAYCIENSLSIRPTHWTQKQVEAYVDHMRAVTDRWLKRETEGLKQRIYTSYP